MSALFAGSVSVLAGTANAAPVGEPLAIAGAVSNITQPVQWRGGGWGWGPAAIAGGIVGGAIVGGALAAPYGPGYYAGLLWPAAACGLRAASRRRDRLLHAAVQVF